MDKKIEVGLMLDFYGQILTPRQDEIVQLYYNQDLSLGEIAENLEITRQGVYDNLKRSEKILYDMEDKLGLVKRFLAQREEISKALMLISEVEDELGSIGDSKTSDKVKIIRKILGNLVDN